MLRKFLAALAVVVPFLALAATAKLAGNVFTADNVQAPNVPRAWVHAAGAAAACPAGVCAIGDSFNVASVTRTAAGTYTVAMTAGVGDVNYAIIPGASFVKVFCVWGIIDANSFQLICYDSLTQVATDTPITAVVFDNN